MRPKKQKTEKTKEIDPRVIQKLFIKDFKICMNNTFKKIETKWRKQIG